MCWCVSLLLLLTLWAFVDAKILWCYQGGGTSGYTPAQCPDGVQECYKYECVVEADDKTSFITRGCGNLAGQSTKNSSLNDSCAQARGVCDQLNGEGLCSTCVRGHMCNVGVKPLASTISTIILLTSMYKYL